MPAAKFFLLRRRVEPPRRVTPPSAQKPRGAPGRLFTLSPHGHLPGHGSVISTSWQWRKQPCAKERPLQSVAAPRLIFSHIFLCMVLHIFDRSGFLFSTNFASVLFVQNFIAAPPLPRSTIFPASGPPRKTRRGCEFHTSPQAWPHATVVPAGSARRTAAPPAGRSGTGRRVGLEPPG